MSYIGEPERVHEIEPAVEPWVVTEPPEEEPVGVPVQPEPDWEKEPA